MAEKKEIRRGLGRGLSALMADVDIAPRSAPNPRSADRTLPIDQVEPNPDQPRRTFSKEDLADLTASVKAKGVLQPLIVRPKPGVRNMYQIVAGERRWRAAQAAKIHDIPVLVRDYSDTEMLEVAIIENIQRSDLNALDEAAGFRQLMDRFGHTQEKLAGALGKSRSHIANLLRLLSLPQEIKDLLAQGLISSGHARALITAEDPIGIAKRIIEEGLSVRETEALAKAAKSATKPDEKKNLRPKKDADTRALEGDLSANLGMKVVIRHGAKDDGGDIVIKYKDLEQLDDLCSKLSGGQ
ncbi:MAG: ParB/RepB/Spo0J family partition protein [Paracoccaceae bacterium]